MNRLNLSAVILAVLATSLAIAEGAILLPNQDFEDAELVWELWPTSSQSRAALDTTVAHHGRQSLRVTATRSSDRAIMNVVTDKCRAGEMYRISVFVRKDAAVPDSAVSYFINYRGGPKRTIKSRSFAFRQTKTPEGAWTRWSGMFLTPPDITHWQFCLGVENTKGRVWFDDIRIEPLGKPADQPVNVWTYMPLGVEIGGGPLKRFMKHQRTNSPVYQRAKRYNRLLLRSAEAERRLLDLQRACFYARRPAPKMAADMFAGAEQRLNLAYRAFGEAFRGAEGKDTEFEQLAHAFETSLQALDRRIAMGARRIRPHIVAPMPPRLGRQPRSVKPLTPSGKMGRLLFGCWSPTQFVEFEKPFDLEFHSNAPGTPKSHTEQTVDFSNITAACDRIEKLGYNGTFAMLLFGVHDNMYAPKWLLEKYKDDPDFIRSSWDGAKGRSSRHRHSLNYFHPAVRAHIKRYLTQYATFCRKEKRILFYEVAQEAMMDFGTVKGGRRESGYGPHARKAFQAWLKKKYATLAKLNKAWSATYASFEAIDQPPDGYVKPRATVTPLIAEFETFREQAYIDYLKLIYDSIKAADPTRPVVARHSSLVREINSARIFETCDILSYHSRAPQMQALNVHLNSLNRIHKRGLGYLEDFWGVQEERDRSWDEIIQRRGLAKHVARVCIWGRTLQMKWYSYTSGAYLTRYDGNWLNHRYDVTTLRYRTPALAVTKRRMERFDWVLTHSTIAPSRVLLLQPSTSMRVMQPKKDVYFEILAWHKLLFRNGWTYELFPEEYFADNRAKLSDYDVVILPKATYMDAAMQDRLAQFLRNGGTLVCTGSPGAYDELGRPSRRMLKKVSAWMPPAKRYAPDRVPPFRTEVGGKSTSVVCASATDLDRDGVREPFLALLAKHARRAAWPEKGRFEVVLRTTEDGDRYLFVLNPNVDATVEDDVILSSRVERALDVSIAGGYPVTLKKDAAGARMPIRLAPGDCAVIHLGKTQ